jgi:3,4-dihydroxy 2-butanone 4-phosphate synthase/GTP cyclohydrolase II
MAFASIQEAIGAIGRGEMIVVVDDPRRENEGDLIMAAQLATADAINFMVTHAKGLVCAPVSGERLGELKLPQMVSENTDSKETAFTVSVDLKEGITTGISARERAVTIRALVDPKTKPEDLARPGHVFPLQAKEGGVLRRAGHTEATVDLARLAGLAPAGVCCEIMKPDGTMARLDYLEEFAQKHNLLLVTIADLIAYRSRREKLVQRVADVTLPTRWGTFRAIAYESPLDDECHLALIKGELDADKPTLVRMHSECLTGDVFGSYRCDCGEQLASAMSMIAQEGIGVLVYMRQEGRGIGLANKLKAYALQERGRDTVEANLELGFPADLRDYGIGAQILVDLGVRKLQLLTNNPFKIKGLEGYGLEVEERIPLEIPPRPENRDYLCTKKEKLGHLLCERPKEDKNAG